MNITKYKTIIFDCDGVVLDSNKVKTEAFYRSVLPYGEDLANEFILYHRNNGGISRYKKFEYFLSEIVSKEIEGLGYNMLLENYAKEVFNGMLSCNVAEGLQVLKDKTLGKNWLIASGGAQEELRDIFLQRGMIDLFDGGIYGSPDTKEIIFQRELGTKNIQTPALFLGDSKYDFLASQKFEEIDFIFLSGWTEVQEWESWIKENHIPTTKNIVTLL